ncbi:CoA transferase [Frigidibacter sp. MR17.24]|uniref:CoA transferase n=1 Tax=Frigidibacter sp. MR17.24 TaxID=3127345 RepID=UPI003012CC44
MYELLDDLRVTEISAFVAAPLAGLQLAQLGAEVIRIDQIGGGPDFGRWPLAPGGASLFWEGLNRGKRSVALDLSRPEGQEIARAVATAPGPGAGLLVTNLPVAGFLAHDRLAALRPDQITLRVMGWPDGRNAVDYTINASLGLPMITGPEDDPRPVNHVLPAWDLITGTTAALALLAAERQRRRDGTGGEIRLPLSDIAVSTLANLGMLAETAVTGHDRARAGNHLFGAFGRDYVAACGARIMLVALTARQWRGLVRALDIGAGVAALEARLGLSFDRDEGLRFRHHAALDPIVARAVAARPLAELAPALEAAQVCWDRYRGLSEAVAEDARLVAANPVFADLAQPSGATYPAPGFAASFTARPRRPPRPTRPIGADTDRVLAEVLGLGEGQIGRLHDQGLARGPTAPDAALPGTASPAPSRSAARGARRR